MGHLNDLCHALKTAVGGSGNYPCCTIEFTGPRTKLKAFHQLSRRNAKLNLTTTAQRETFAVSGRDILKFELGSTMIKSQYSIVAESDGDAEAGQIVVTCFSTGDEPWQVQLHDDHGGLVEGNYAKTELAALQLAVSMLLSHNATKTHCGAKP